MHITQHAETTRRQRGGKLACSAFYRVPSRPLIGRMGGVGTPCCPLIGGYTECLWVYVCGPVLNVPWPPRGRLSAPGDALATQEYTQIYISHSMLEFVGVGPAMLIEGP